MSELKLLPCPFCGGEAEYYKRYIGYGSSGLGAHDWFSVKCEKCRTKSDEYKTEAEAIAAWNRRAEPESVSLVRCGECAKYQSPNCAAKHEQALRDFCSHGVRKPERSEGKW